MRNLPKKQPVTISVLPFEVNSWHPGPTPVNTGHAMPEFTILAPTAILGYGFPETSLQRGLAAAESVFSVVDEEPEEDLGIPAFMRKRMKRS